MFKAATTEAYVDFALHYIIYNSVCFMSGYLICTIYKAGCHYYACLIYYSV